MVVLCTALDIGCARTGQSQEECALVARTPDIHGFGREIQLDSSFALSNTRFSENRPNSRTGRRKKRWKGDFGENEYETWELSVETWCACSGMPWDGCIIFSSHTNHLVPSGETSKRASQTFENSSGQIVGFWFSLL